MSAWRRKAIDCVPELAREFEQPGTSIYGVFIELLPALVKAHRDADTERAKKIYSFALWCLHSSDKEISNAAAVTFYEHLGDYEETRCNISRWVSRTTYEEIRGLLESRATSEQVKIMDATYRHN